MPYQRMLKFLGKFLKRIKPRKSMGPLDDIIITGGIQRKAGAEMLSEFPVLKMDVAVLASCSRTCMY